MRTGFRTKGLIAGAAILGLAGCSAEVPTQSALLPALTITPGDQVIGVRVCKVAEDPETVGQVFTFHTMSENLGDPGNDGSPVPEVQATAVDLATATADDCVLVWSRAGATFDDETEITVSEALPPGYHLDRISFSGTGAPGEVVPPAIDNPATTSVTFKPYAGMSVFFKNSTVAPSPPPPPPPTQSSGCTYTKGWYQNRNGAPTVIAVDGRTEDEARQILAATPGRPGSVTWTGGNSVLNLYQQFLAALINLGGDANEDAGPAEVTAAIDAVRDGTGGSGTSITSTLTPSQIGGLSATLAAFNEGQYPGWPHCGD